MLEGFDSLDSQCNVRVDCGHLTIQELLDELVLNEAVHLAHSRAVIGDLL